MSTALATCPICESESVSKGMIGCHQVHQCVRRECGHLFSVSADEKAGEMVPEDSADHDRSEYRKRNLSLISRWQSDGFLKNGDGVLDIGAGTGHIASALRESGSYVISCVETGDALREDLCKGGFSAYESIDAIPQDIPVHCALMIEVIEHLEHPVDVLRQLYQRIHVSGGTLFLTTPAGGARQRSLICQNQLTFHNPQHVQFFTPNSLEYALKKAGFTSVKYRYMPEMMAFFSGGGWGKYHLVRLKQLLKYHLAGVLHITVYAH